MFCLFEKMNMKLFWSSVCARMVQNVEVTFRVGGLWFLLRRLGASGYALWPWHKLLEWFVLSRDCEGPHLAGVIATCVWYCLFKICTQWKPWQVQSDSWFLHYYGHYNICDFHSLELYHISDFGAMCSRYRVKSAQEGLMVTTLVFRVWLPSVNESFLMCGLTLCVVPSEWHPVVGG